MSSRTKHRPRDQQSPSSLFHGQGKIGLNAMRATGLDVFSVFGSIRVLKKSAPSFLNDRGYRLGSGTGRTVQNAGVNGDLNLSSFSLYTFPVLY